MQRLGISLGGRTSNDSSFNPNKPQNFLFTTPESADSLLCRYSKVLKNIKFIVVDELHFLDNTYRGDQLMILLNRIRQNLTKPEVGIYCMSATINNPDGLVSRYMKSAEICRSSEIRDVTYLPIDTRKYANYWANFRAY